MNWLGKFILALIGCTTAFFAIFSGSCSEIVKYAAKVTPPAEATPTYIPVPVTPSASSVPQYLPSFPTPASPAQPAGPIKFAIIDQLGPGQTADTTNVAL